MGMKRHSLGCPNFNIMAVPDPLAFKKSFTSVKMTQHYLIFHDFS